MPARVTNGVTNEPMPVWLLPGNIDAGAPMVEQLYPVECFACRKVTLISAALPPERCDTCGSANVAIRSPQEVRDGLEGGVYFNIDPRTGKRAKKKRR